MFSVRGASKQAGPVKEQPATLPVTAEPGRGPGLPPEPPQGGGPGRPGGHQRRMIILAGACALAVIAAAAGYALTHSGGSSPGSGKSGGSGLVAALRVASVSPVTGDRRVDGGAPVIVQFNAPLAAGSPMPAITPPVRGTWTRVANDATFTPETAFAPSHRYTVRVPAGASGVRIAGGKTLARPVVSHFTTRGYAPLRMAQLLSQLGYLPLTWSPTAGPATRSEEMDSGLPTSQQALAFDPPGGSFSWQAAYPTLLTDQWQPHQWNVVMKGAVMAFQSEHHLTVDGSTGPALWGALFRAVRKDERNVNGYTYAVASKSLPETLTIWHDGRQVFRSLANTGIPVSPTVDGTFPVYQKFRFQIMRGVNPDGSSYADPVSYVSYFNGGDAVHYFPRGSYGFQQSLGCVELPYSSAEQAYPYLTYGSLVTVAG